MGRIRKWPVPPLSLWERGLGGEGKRRFAMPQTLSLSHVLSALEHMRGRAQDKAIPAYAGTAICVPLQRNRLTAEC
jgi:hypothetical protein